MKPCSHGMPTPKACLDCMNEGNLPTPLGPEEERRDSVTIHGKFDGQCPACNLPTFGDEICRTTFGRWIHVGCLP